MPTVPSSPYIDALRAWNKSAAEWLGLDPTEVFEFDAERDERVEEWHVTWVATDAQSPRIGHVGAPNLRGVDERVDHLGDLYLTGGDAVDFEAAVGPKPEQFTPEGRAQLTLLAKGRA